MKGQATLWMLFNLYLEIVNRRHSSPMKNMIGQRTKMQCHWRQMFSRRKDVSGRKSSITIKLKTLLDLYVLNMTHQHESMHMCYGRNYPDATAEIFSKLEQYFFKRSDIIKDVLFKSAVVKTRKADLYEKPLKLTRVKTNDLRYLMKPEIIVIEIYFSGKQSAEWKLCAALQRFEKPTVTLSNSSAKTHLKLRFVWQSSHILWTDVHCF